MNEYEEYIQEIISRFTFRNPNELQGLTIVRSGWSEYLICLQFDDGSYFALDSYYESQWVVGIDYPLDIKDLRGLGLLTREEKEKLAFLERNYNV